MILTDVCNFKCPYCRGIAPSHQGTVSWEKAAFIIDMWGADGLKNIRFSGGEPALWKGYETMPDGTRERRSLIDLVVRAKSVGIKRIAISTNGSVATSFYRNLVDAGANDFSISLDACCAETGDKMAGGIKGAWNRVVNNIRELSKITYVTVGVVFTEENIHEFNDVVKFASGLGVSDIRILSSAQWDEKFGQVDVYAGFLEKHPILKYRLANFNGDRHVRGLRDGDNKRCPLMLDDMAILDGEHYPCIIYMREQGKAVGKVDYSLSPEDAIRKIRLERKAWSETRDTHEDAICKKNCLDVCIDYNNRCKTLNPRFSSSRQLKQGA